MKEIKEITKMLEQVEADPTVPKNVRKACKLAIESLNDNNKELAIKLNSAVSLLDAVADDPNMPVYARTKIWATISKLEKM